MKLVNGIVPIAIGLFVAFLGQALLARVVGPEVFGGYVYILSWASGAALLAKAGQEWVLLKAIPVYIQNGAWGQIRFIVERGFRIVARRAASWAMFLAALSLVSGRMPSLSILAASFALVVVLALAEMRRSWALAHRAIWLSDAPESIIKSLVLLCAAWMFASSNHAISPANLLWLNVVTTALTALTAIAIFIRFKAPGLLRATAEPVDTLDHDSVSRGMWFSTATNILLSSADIFVVGLLFDAATTGVYAIASRIAALAAAPTMIMSRIAAPLISAAAGLADHVEVRRISRGYVAITTAASLAIFLFVQFAGQSTIQVIFGAAFLEAEPAAKILIFGHVAIALMGPAGLLMAVSGGHMQNAIISAASAVIGLLLLAVLTPIYGPIGAAFAAASALVFKSFVSAVWIWTRLGIDTTFLTMVRGA